MRELYTYFVPHGPNCKTQSIECYLDWNQGEEFQVRGVDCAIVVPQCHWYFDQCLGGRVKFYVDFLEKQTGIEFIHGKERHSVVWRYMSPFDVARLRETVLKAIHAIPEIYRSPYTYYYERKPFERLARAFRSQCRRRHCTKTYDSWNFTPSTRGTWSDGFCSTACQRKYWRAESQRKQRLQKEMTWLREGGKELQEIRRWLRDRKTPASLTRRGRNRAA